MHIPVYIICIYLLSFMFNIGCMFTIISFENTLSTRDNILILFIKNALFWPH